MFKYLILFITFGIYLTASETYTCEIDTVKYLNNNEVFSIPKGFRTKVILKLNDKNFVNVNIGNETYYDLKYIETQKLMKITNVDIYEKDSVQLEIIDISNSWSTGARLFR